MVEPEKNFDYVAREGKQIGFAVDDRWCGGGPVNVAVKITYFDRGLGTVSADVKTTAGNVSKKIELTGTDKLRTATFLIKNAVFPAKKMDYDVVLKSTGTTLFYPSCGSLVRIDSQRRITLALSRF